MNIRRNRLTKLTAQAFMLAVIISCCAAKCMNVTDFDISQTTENGDKVLYSQANTEATFVTSGWIECHEDHTGVNFVIAYLVPKSWKAAENAKVTYKCDLAEDHDMIMKMSVVPNSSLPKNGQGRTWVECLTQEYGVGTNVLDDMEWVVYQTDDKWNIINNQFPTFKIFFTTNVGDKNLRFHPAVFINHTDDGFSGGTDHKTVVYSPDCFEVVGGSGLVLDFCNDHFNKISPMSSLQNDYITFTFKGSAADNDLAATKEVYLQGTAYTADGGQYTMNVRDAKSRMVRENAYSDTYNITFWPVDFFGVPEDAVIEHIEYYFCNADGTITITQSDDDLAQLGTPIPAVKEPFVFRFECE